MPTRNHMARPQLIVVTGRSGSGKTTLATALSHALHLPLLSKDAIKEALFDSLGWSDRAWSRRLGTAAITVLYRQLDLAGCARSIAPGGAAAAAGSRWPRPGRRHG